MTFLPIVERELRVRARQVATYRGRWVAVAVALMVATPSLLAGGPRGAPPSGKNMFVTLTVMAFAFCLFEGARQAADCLSRERREATLGLLFLTDLKGYDVVLGKLAGIALNPLYGLAAIMPVLGLGLLAGGVTGGEFWRVTLVLVTTLIFSLATGICVSARGVDEQKVFGGAMLALVVITGGLPLVEYLVRGGIFGTHGSMALFSPGYGCYLGFDSAYRANGAAFWRSLLLVNLLSGVLLCLAAVQVKGFRQDEPERESIWQKLGLVRREEEAGLNQGRVRTKAGRRDLDRNPVYWLARRSSGRMTLVWVLVAVTIGLLGMQLVGQSHQLRSAGRPFSVLSVVSSYASMLVRFAFWYCLTAMVCRFFVDARRSGSLELLLSSPLRDKDIMEGCWLNLRRIVLGPVCCLWAVSTLHYVCFWLIITHYQGSQRVSLSPPVFVNAVLSAVGFAVEAMALCWVGLWLSLTSKKPAQASVKTFLLVVVLPSAVCSGFPLYGLRFWGPGMNYWMIYSMSFGGVVVQILWLIWARRKMQPGVRTITWRQMAG